MGRCTREGGFGRCSGGRWEGEKVAREEGSGGEGSLGRK